MSRVRCPHCGHVFTPDTPLDDPDAPGTYCPECTEGFRHAERV